MRYHFYEDQPVASVLAFFYQFSTTMTALAIGLGLALWGRRRLLRARWSTMADPGLDGSSIAREILKVGDAAGWSVVQATDALGTYYDPWRREVRLSPAVGSGRTLPTLAIAAQQAGRALRSARGDRLDGPRVALILGARLVSVVAWLTFLTGAWMLTPGLTDRGALLYAGSVLALLVAQWSETSAGRLALDAIRRGGLDASWSLDDREAFGRAIEAVGWVAIASTLPVPRRWSLAGWNEG